MSQTYDETKMSQNWPIGARRNSWRIPEAAVGLTLERRTVKGVSRLVSLESLGSLYTCWKLFSNKATHINCPVSCRMMLGLLKVNGALFARPTFMKNPARFKHGSPAMLIDSNFSKALPKPAGVLHIRVTV